MTDAVLRCPDHNVDLEHRPYNDTIRALRCPAEADSFMSTANRWCTRCGARNASWMSGTCDSCYRLTEQQHREAERERRHNSAVLQGISTAIQRADEEGNTDVAAWLRAYKEKLP